MEGLRQKGWTCVGILLLRSTIKHHTVFVEVLAQGDNQILSLFNAINSRPLTKEYNTDLCRLKEKTKDILNETILASKSIGLPLKEDETWVLRSVFLYGKVPVVKGALRSFLGSIPHQMMWHQLYRIA